MWWLILILYILGMAGCSIFIGYTSKNYDTLALSLFWPLLLIAGIVMIVMVVPFEYGKYLKGDRTNTFWYYIKEQCL